MKKCGRGGQEYSQQGEISNVEHSGPNVEDEFDVAGESSFFNKSQQRNSSLSLFSVSLSGSKKRMTHHFLNLNYSLCNNDLNTPLRRNSVKTSCSSDPQSGFCYIGEKIMYKKKKSLVTRGVQSTYRESDAQTDPWVPPYKILNGKPEVFTLAFMKYGECTKD
ncbi:unnamed protein product [Nesidiocoris tenuis]|uniref:CFAP91 domain-containing protein n=1 Tax=Nesidiocoris tenuis TaxID=355587 RepID=A0A6H5GNK5_9HEMI|nr:unnamed protein product [Nesidiocoris tenuis]